jgi:hypothetical protein
MRRVNEAVERILSGDPMPRSFRQGAIIDKAKMNPSSPSYVGRRKPEMPTIGPALLFAIEA